MSLMQLPTELHLVLVPMLDYKSLINHTRTNRHFLSLRTDELVRQALLHFENMAMTPGPFELRDGIVWPKQKWADCATAARVQDMLPCYGCLRLRKRYDFPWLGLTGAPELGGQLGGGRRRINCETARLTSLGRRRVKKSSWKEISGIL